MILGSHIEGLNNIICRAWVWKGLPLGAGLRSGPDFMRAHIKVGSDCIAKPYIDIVWRVWLLGIIPRSIIFSPFFPLFSNPLLPSLSIPFILMFTSHSSSTCQFFLVWGNYLSYQSIRQGGWEKLDSMIWSMGLSGAGLRIMVLAAFSLVLLLYWVCTFLQAFLWDVGREVVLGHILGPSRSFHCASSAAELLGLGFGPLIQSGLGPQI